ncbi:MAG TPA: 30S ribosomal protein S20 [bacterium]
MAKRSKSGLKRKRQSVARRLRNQGVQSQLKTAAKQAGDSPEQLTAAIAALDRAARKGIIHKNTAARKKSRLLKRSTTR